MESTKEPRESLRTPEIEFDNESATLTNYSNVARQVSCDEEACEALEFIMREMESESERASEHSVAIIQNQQSLQNEQSQPEPSSSRGVKRVMTCKKCSKNIKKHVYSCSNCRDRYHWRCTGFYTVEIKKFICLPCEKAYKIFSEFES